MRAERPGVRHRVRLLAGLTLLEMLVTLALVALMTTVLMQAANQVRRVEQLMDSGSLSRQPQHLRIEWLRAAAEAGLPMANGSPDQYRGSANQVSWITTQAPGQAPGTLARVELRLQYDDRQGATQLVARVGNDDQSQRQWSVLSWPGRKGRLAYIDAKGEWQASWPAASLSYAPLPAALVIDPDDGVTPAVVLRAVVGPDSEPTRRALETL